MLCHVRVLVLHVIHWAALAPGPQHMLELRDRCLGLRHFTGVQDADWRVVLWFSCTFMHDQMLGNRATSSLRVVD